MVKELSACKDEIWELKNSVEPLRERVAQLQRELTEALADKAALEQEMILKGAQKAASKRAWRVSGIPKIIASLCFIISMPFWFLGCITSVPLRHLFSPPRQLPNGLCIFPSKHYNGTFLRSEGSSVVVQ